MIKRTPSSSEKRMMGARIDEQLARLLKVNAARKGTTVQQILESLVRAYLQREGDLK
ncbi:MAG TPA: hypothetical protein VEI28_01200 [Thermodesulfovibrionales bacterium]|nr:hypothetical protein [Thermodesulfovibrionales bacterium]